jgi:DnaJ domain
MSDKMALKIAIDLIHVPSQVRLFRSQPLPDGVVLLLRVVAGDEEAERSAVELAARSIGTVRQASTFFIEQIMFAPDADSYRVLGTHPQASAAELRRNLALLLRWLHPDLDPQGRRSVFVGRVTAAWNNLKTPERRAAYDDLQHRAHDKRKSRKAARRNGAKPAFGVSPRRRSRAPDGAAAYRPEKVGLLRRALSALFHRPPP